ncbi:hypothetical protein JTE90_010770 [Oedothorax gibbosus]|uniref:Telomere length regulation protein TEL2 homolog n=1 Tax=Oedothorax gibbosus TaxID=931172 RepID=A0AAV6TZ41_9ARAC|nr:hypothetical protein JTE90_010770 [Oedothorax gibbosus]
MEGKYDDISSFTVRFNEAFNAISKDQNKSEKWSLLKEFHAEYVVNNKISASSFSSYHSILSTLLDALKPTLFNEKWQENQYDDIFLCGILHEAFMILVRKLDTSCESFQQLKILNLLEKFLRGKSYSALILQQCLSQGTSDPEYIALSSIWNDLITLMVSLPERVANKTKGMMHKIFHADCYIPLMISAVLKTLTALHQRISESHNCTLEFIGKLLGKLCILGYSDKVTQRLSMVLVIKSEKDFIWRKVCQNLITKMPFAALEPFMTQFLLSIPWYGYVEWILGDEGTKNNRLNYILTTKLILVKHFKKPLIIQNIIGYYAGDNARQSQFYKILNSLLQTWSDESALKHQSAEQQKYLASALVICAGWINRMKNNGFQGEAYTERALHGTTIRIGNSEEFIRNLGMVVGSLLMNALHTNGPKLTFEDCVDKSFLFEFENLLIVPTDPGKKFLYSEELNCFTEEKSENNCKKSSTPEKDITEILDTKLQLNNEDGLEAYDMSSDVPLESEKHPFYLNDCLQGMIEQENADWFEQCLKHAESLIEANSDIIDEVAIEMTKVVIHLEDKYSIPDFDGMKHRILVSLTVHSPIMVSEYLASQFYEKDYNISQRLIMLDVLAQGSRILSKPLKEDPQLIQDRYSSKAKFAESVEKTWKSIVDQRIATKTRFITKSTPKPPLPETPNRFSMVAGYFFYPLISKYDKSHKMLKLFGEDSYVLGRLIYTLGVIMLSASNIPSSKAMGEALLEFLSHVQSHVDVFVRQASIFSMAAVYSSVPGYLLFTDDIVKHVDDSKQWLQSTIEGDPDTNCQLKASYALGYLISIMEQEVPQLQNILNELR